MRDIIKTLRSEVPSQNRCRVILLVSVVSSRICFPRWLAVIIGGEIYDCVRLYDLY